MKRKCETPKVSMEIFQKEKKSSSKKQNRNKIERSSGEQKKIKEKRNKK